MNKKIKTNISVFTILAIVFSCVGAFFLVMGGIFFFQKLREVVIVGICFLSTGAAFLAVGILMWIISYSKKKKIRKIVDEGYYINAELAGTSVMYNIAVNGRCPYVINARYQDEQGCVHFFKSRHIYYNPEGLFQSDMVRVYLRRGDYRVYYMDIESVLPMVALH